MVGTLTSPLKGFYPVIGLKAKMGDPVNADDNGKEENKNQTFFNGKTLKSLEVQSSHRKCNQKKETVYCMRSNRRMEQVHLEVLKRWW